MDSNALGFVGQAVMTTTIIGALAGSAISFVRNLPGAGIAMGMNCGISGAIFFGSREFVVSPLLVEKLDTSQYTRRRASLASGGAPVRTDIGQVRMNRLVDSCISGAFTGTVLHSIMRGRNRLFAGALTGSLVCTLLQYGTNELNIARIRYVSGRVENTPAPFPTPSDSGEPPVTTIHQHDLNLPHQNPKANDNRQDTRDYSAQSTIPYTFSERILDGMSYVLPIKKLTPQEYAALQERKRLEEAAGKGGDKSSRESTEGDSP